MRLPIPGVAGDAVEVAIGQVKGYFVPSDAERAAAYELLVELSTRTTSAGVASTDGTIRDALTSIEEMFEITREVLRRHGAEASKGSAGNISLAVVAVRVLNEVFRPVLARWEPLLAEHEGRLQFESTEIGRVEWERQWVRDAQCRLELREMRSSIRAYIDTLSRIAGASAIADAVLGLPPSKMIPPERHPDPVPPATGPNGLQPRREMVKWFSAIAGFKMVRSYRPAEASLEKYTTRTSVPEGPTETFAVDKGEDFWFDYVADMGDGFDGTAPVAWLVGRKLLELPVDPLGELPTPPTTMPRGRLLVFGGDEIYPNAMPGGYERHTELPYRMGIEGGPDGSDPVLIALAGNHDWMGGIEHFEKMFNSGRTFAGHWRTVQSNNWWHVKLPQGWWLWGIDTGLHNELIGDQKDYFTRAAELLRPGDRVILISPVPLWQLRQKFPEAYTKVRAVLDPLVVGQGATMPLFLSADTHVFAHLERLDTDFGEDHICAGGGGAFLQPTHNFPERIPLEKGNAEFKLTDRWPRPADSRSLAPGANNVLSRQYLSFLVIFVGLHLAFAGLANISWPDAWSVAERSTSLTRWGDWGDWYDGLLLTLGSPWTIALLAVPLLSGFVMFKGNSLEPKLGAAARGYGIAVGAVWALSILAVAAVRRQFGLGPDWVGVTVWSVVGGVVSLYLFLKLYRWANGRIKAGDTFAFSAAQSTRFKHFLRFRIDRRGDLTCFVVGIDPVGEGWYDAMAEARTVPPYDPAGIPRLHYVWGKTYGKFVPVPLAIAVSISDVEAADGTAGVEAFEHVATVLIDGGHTLMYGGWPDAGYTARLHAVERARHVDNVNPGNHLINYVPDYLWTAPGAPHRDDPNPTIRSIRVKRSPAEGETETQSVIADLTAMRRHMTRRAGVRIVIGGSLRPGGPQTRRAPGIVEEAYLALEADVPLIVAGGFGGAAGLLADAMLGRLDPADLDELATHFVVPERDADGVGFSDMVARFTSTNVLSNGLTHGENLVLLHSNDINTVSALILRSVHRIGSHHAH